MLYLEKPLKKKKESYSWFCMCYTYMETLDYNLKIFNKSSLKFL